MNTDADAVKQYVQAIFSAFESKPVKSGEMLAAIGCVIAYTAILVSDSSLQDALDLVTDSAEYFYKGMSEGNQDALNEARKKIFMLNIAHKGLTK